MIDILEGSITYSFLILINILRACIYIIWVLFFLKQIISNPSHIVNWGKILWRYYNPSSKAVALTYRTVLKGWECFPDLNFN